MKYLFILFFFFQICSISAFGQEYKYHPVKAGETIYSIAKSYNISEDAIYKYNPDARQGIDVATKLVIPLNETEAPAANKEAEVQFRTHKVARKETLYSLSREYNVEVDDIKRYNKHLYAEELQRGEEIRIPVFSSGNKTQGRDNAPSLNQDQISDTREHVVLPKETKYGIARKYGLTVKELEALNPTVEVLQPGVMLKVGTNVSEDPVILMDNAFEFYEVKPQETLFGLSKKFGVEQDSLIALNPSLEDGLKWGMVLKVPNRGKGVGNLDETETEDFKSDPIEEEAEAVELDLRSKLTNFDTKELVLMLPYNLNRIDTDSTETYKDAILNDRVLRISMDFYTGVLMALEEAKELGISTNLRVYDTKQSRQEVTTIINTNNFRNVDAVIGPLIKTTIETATSKLASQNVPVISPISNSTIKKAPSNFFQSRPTDEMMEAAMVNYLANNSTDKNVIIIADRNSRKIKQRLSGVLPFAKFVNPEDGDVNEDEISEALSEDKENWVILEATRVGVLSSATSALNRLARDTDITLFTTKRSNNYDNDNVSNDHLARLNFHYPSIDKEFDAQRSGKFVEEYEEEYGTSPNQYAIRGYDITLDVLLKLAVSGNLYEFFEEHKGYTEYHENKFNYKSNSEGGFLNDAVYIMRMNSDLTLSVVDDDSKGNL